MPTEETFPAAMPDTTIRYYTTHVKDLVLRYESADVQDLHTLLADSFLPGARLLELGCGSGRDAAFMLENGFDVLFATTSPDGLGRKTITWLNCLAVC